MPMVEVLWARHGQNVANLTRTLSYRVFDGDLTQTGREQARALAGRLAADGGEPIGTCREGMRTTLARLKRELEAA
jgi:broad specificity phosphatase PhoE